MSDIFDDLSYAFIEFYVGMAKMVTYWHVKALGFELKGYRGPESAATDEISYLLCKGDINLVITSAAKPSAYNVLSFIDRHGNGVKRIAYRVRNVTEAYATAISRGAIPVADPKRYQDSHGSVERASIRLLDRKEITFFDGSNYEGCFMPGFIPYEITGFTPNFDSGFQVVDHIAYGLHVNEMDFWCNNYFQKIFGGQVVQDIGAGDVITEYSGLLLRLLTSENGALNNVFVEPQNHERASQVQEYVDAYYGSGVQHMAFATDNIFETVAKMRYSGVDFVTYPACYYELLREEGHCSSEIIDKAQKYGVLCDAQQGAYLFQTFTKPFGDRPTFFYEVIQRVGAYQGFALDNITQLFRAVEREQEKRSGN